MRIKLKAYLKAHNQTVSVDNIDFIEKEITVIDEYGRDYYFPFDEIVLLQYTGLKDKNGKEIYEGDIVDFGGEHIVKFGEFGVPNIEDQEYQDHAVGFYFEPAHDLKDIEPFSMTIPLNEIYSKQARIIGSVYENPELLEVESHV